MILRWDRAGDRNAYFDGIARDGRNDPLGFPWL